MSTYTVGQPARVLRDSGRHGTVLQPVTVTAVDGDGNPNPIPALWTDRHATPNGATK